MLSTIFERLTEESKCGKLMGSDFIEFLQSQKVHLDWDSQSYITEVIFGGDPMT